MSRPVAPDHHADAQLFGILLAGLLRHTRPDCAVQVALEPERRPSGIHRIVRAGSPRDPES